MKILLIEDEEDQREAFKEAVEVFNDDENNQGVEPDTAANLSEASNKIDGSYDGVIIDLVLGNDADGGNKIVRQLGDSFTRIPIIFVTAFPEDVVDHPSIIHTRRRSDGIYTSDLLLFQKIYDTGLTRIMGGRGLIEQRLNDVFLKNLLPQINTWISYAETDSERTEKALLRYALNHLIQFLEEDEKLCFPEEFYLYPPVSEGITTGSIVKEKMGDQPFVVLSPACDLVIRRDGEFKTDRILLIEIESENDVVNTALDGIRRRQSKENKLRDVFNNNHRDYYHWLPPTDFFGGGILNFRKLKTLNENDFNEKFGKPTIQISPSFVKDIVSRFSSYYARQGQPDIDNKDFIDRYTT
ncbi:MAG: response regulator [Candidatus Poribacteria bacterium]|nr:response regulator [Candidatus Poribacteria bacterium]